MLDQEPATRTMKIAEVKATFSRIVTEVYHTKTRVLVEKTGIPVAALVSVEDLERLQQLDRDREVHPITSAGTRARPFLRRPGRGDIRCR